MTNHWNDLANSDCILIMGSNPAENHPISFKWVLKAQDKGAKVVSVDPRFTHSSSKADFYVQLRVGTDIAFLGGMINYILNNDKYFKQYVIDSTNGPTVVGERFGFSDGLFSGFNADKKSYDKKTWAFEMDANGVPVRDETLTHPRCVLQLLKKHYDRYTLDKVSETTGTPKEDLLRVYETFASTGAPDKAGTIMYAMGWTQKSVGVQNIRAMSIIQLLLGNIGVAGGGVNALRGESNVQGSTDQALLADIWPGYLPVPTSTLTTLADYNATTPKTNDPKSVNWWGNRPKYTASFLMSLYPGVTPDVAYSYVPRLDADKKRTDYMWMSIFDRMVEGKLDGLFAWGMNPACSGPNANKSRGAMEKLKWLVNVNLFDNETGSFWRGPGKDPTQIATEVFFLPCCTSIEKEGSIANSGRWMQWRYAGPDRYGETKPDGDIMVEMMLAIRKLYKEQGGVFPEPILGLGIDKWMEGHEFSPANTAKVMNGYFLRDVTIGGKLYKAGHQVPAFAMLQADGSTASGNWLHAGSRQDADAGTGKDRPVPELVLRMAHEPPHHLQPRLRGQAGPPVEPGQAGHPVARRQVGRRRGGRRRRSRHQIPLHHAEGRPGRALRARPRRRTAPRVLRTDGIALREARLLRAAQQPRGVQGHRRSAGRGGRAFPVHRHDLPRHRALADGPHDPPLLVAGGSRDAGLRGA